MKNLIILFLFVFSLSLKAQSDIALNISQDARLAFLGDDKGNDPFTADLIARIDLQDIQRKKGYYITGIEFEFANLDKIPYKRYSLNFGYTFNYFSILGNDKIEATALLNYGMTIRRVIQVDKRVDKSFLGFASSFTLAYPIGKGFKIQITSQLSHRVDKNTLYGSDASYTFQALKIDYSGFIGLQYQFKINKTP
jgi:hypothetical protein